MSDRTELETGLTDVLRRLRMARLLKDPVAEQALSKTLDYGLAKWQREAHGAAVAP
jgi:hypothetical protein